MELLELHYEASGPSIRAVVDTVAVIKGRETVIVGGPRPPTRHLTLEKLMAIDPELVADFQSVLKRLEPIVRALAAQDTTDPDRIRAEANRVALARQALETQQVETAERVKALLIEEYKRQQEHEEQQAKRLAEQAALDAAIEARRNELAALSDAAPTELRPDDGG